MKKVLFLLFLICITTNVNAAYWLCKVIKNVNLRECPSTDCNKICTLPVGSYVVVDFSTIGYDENAFVNAIYVEKNIEGYVSSKFLKKEEVLKVDKNGVFQKVGTSYGYDPELNIYNKTDRLITVKINGKNYAFKPYEKRSITCEPGDVDIMASSPGVLPYIGKDKVDSNSQYEWHFFIKTSYR